MRKLNCPQREKERDEHELRGRVEVQSAQEGRGVVGREGLRGIFKCVGLEGGVRWVGKGKGEGGDERYVGGGVWIWVRVCVGVGVVSP